MLNANDYCRLPRGPLQPDAPPHEVRVPAVQFSEKNLVTTEEGYEIAVYYDVQRELWRSSDVMLTSSVVWPTAAGHWSFADISEWPAIRERLPAPTHFKTIRLPSYPQLPQNAQPIPRQVHHIWVGTSVPGQTLLENMTRNALHTQGYACTLHVDVSSELLGTLTELFKTRAPNLNITHLQGSVFFEQFKNTRLYPHYLNATTGAGANFGAASDMLRYPLVNHYGGIYMDVDDAFTTPIAKMDFPAAPNDVLLGNRVTHVPSSFDGYNSSIFATHSKNPVLTEITEEMINRCDQDTRFFTDPRPRFTAEHEYTPAFRDYSKRLFSLTGPQLLNDVMARERPDYYSLMFNLSTAHGTTSTFGVLDRTYTEKVLTVAEHYFPFYKRAPVKIGTEHAWAHT